MTRRVIDKVVNDAELVALSHVGQDFRKVLKLLQYPKHGWIKGGLYVSLFCEKVCFYNENAIFLS